MTSELYLGFKTTFIGMTIVFIALYALMLVLESMRVLFYRGEQAIIPPAVPTPAEVGTEPTVPRSVLAAISAAVYALLDGRGANIIAIRREQPSLWQQAARAESTTRQSD